MLRDGKADQYWTSVDRIESILMYMVTYGGSCGQGEPPSQLPGIVR